jgi:hypothetical protein
MQGSHISTSRGARTCYQLGIFTQVLIELFTNVFFSDRLRSISILSPHKMKSDEQYDVFEGKEGPPGYDKHGVQISSDPEFGHGDALPEETTKRGLKARHAQMIALGGTIGT